MTAKLQICLLTHTAFLMQPTVEMTQKTWGVSAFFFTVKSEVKRNGQLVGSDSLAFAMERVSIPANSQKQSQTAT